MTPSVYVSTACLRGRSPLSERLSLYAEHGIKTVELGAGVTVDIDLPAGLPKDTRFLIHNYFPPPVDPFIVNLASQDEEIRSQSIALAKRALMLSADFGAKVYSIHSGFVVDPSLDLQFPPAPGESEVKAALDRFITVLTELLPFAEKCGVRLLVENNVCEVKHKGVLLLQTPEEFDELFRRVPSKHLGILLDTGHWNVSANTFGFDPIAGAKKVLPHVGAFHLHENDSTADQHRPIADGSWTLDILRTPEALAVPWVIEAKFADSKTLEQHFRELPSLVGKKV